MKKKWVNIGLIFIIVFCVACFAMLINDCVTYWDSYYYLEKLGSDVSVRYLRYGIKYIAILVFLALAVAMDIFLLIAFNKTEIKAMTSSVQEIKEKRAQIKAEKQEQKRQKKMQALQAKMQELEKDGK